MNITERYLEYKIFNNLQLHQLRVAAVAAQICAGLTIPVDAETVIRVCLLHDMGNVLKLDFTKFPEFFEPEGVEYWQEVRAQFAEKYGEDEHEATLQIAREIIGSSAYDMYLNAFGHTHAPTIASLATLEEKICTYADMRVAPRGITSMLNRFNEMRDRYKDHPTKKLGTEEELAAQLQAFFDIEKTIFEHSKIKPEDITEASSHPIMETLRKLEI